MSYDLFLFKPEPGQEPLFAAQHFYDAWDHNKPAPLAPAREAEKRRLASALLKLNPALEMYEPNYAELAKGQGITEEDARRKHRYIEFGYPEARPGIGISIADDHANIELPFWYSGEEARAVLQEVWRYLEFFHTEAGYVTYDSQVERILDFGSDFELVLGEYAGGVRCAQQVVTTKARQQQKRVWWKFWHR